MKKGQVTVFIILGIIIVAGISLFAYYGKGIGKSSAEREAAILSSLPPDAASLRQETAECSQLLLEDAIITAGQYAGYNSPLENYLEESGVIFNYGYFEGANVLPSIEQVKLDISEYIETFLPGCVGFENYPYEISQEAPKAEIFLEDGKVSAKVDYKITARKETKEFSIKEPYEAEAEADLLGAYNTASEIVGIVEQNPESIDISSMIDLNADITAMPIDDKTAIYSIEDKDAKLIGPEGTQTLIFAFAARAR